MQERGFIPAEQVRSVTLENVIVDMGARRLCLPLSIDISHNYCGTGILPVLDKLFGRCLRITQLGLTLDEEIEVKTAAGVQKARLFKRLSLAVEGRKGEFNCMELPGCEDSLLGLIPLESLGLQPDIIHQRLIVLPDRGRNTYHLAL